MWQRNFHFIFIHIIRSSSIDNIWNIFKSFEFSEELNWRNFFSGFVYNINRTCHILDCEFRNKLD